MDNSTLIIAFDEYGETLAEFTVPVLLDLAEVVHYHQYSYAYHFDSTDPESLDSAEEICAQAHVVDVKQNRSRA